MGANAMLREALSYGDRRLDAELEQLWRAIEELRTSTGSGGTTRHYTEAIVAIGDSPPVAGPGAWVMAELDGDPQYSASGMLVDQSDGLSVGYDEEQGLPVLQADVVQTLAKGGETGLTGDVTLSAGSNVTLTQVGQDIEIAAGTGGAWPVTLVELGDDDDPYTLTAPAGEGVVCVKNTGSQHTLRIKPPSGHYIIDNSYFGTTEGRTTHYLNPGWAVGYYYPGSGTTWRSIWLWQPTQAQLHFNWFNLGYSNEVSEPEQVTRYGDLDLTDGDYEITGLLVVVAEPGGRNMSSYAGVYPAGE